MNKPGKSFIVIGVDGLIGGALARKLALEGATVHTTAKPGSKKAADVALDLAAADIEQIALPRADVAVLCASINGFAACRRDPATARQVNAVAPEILTRQLRKNGTRVIYLSSSAVFDFQVPHIEASAPTCARTVYGAVKAEGEERVLAQGQGTSVIRFAKVLSADMPLFNSWKGSLGEGKTIGAFSDLHFSPISLDFAIEAVLAIAKAGEDGIYQVSGASDISYAAAARHIAKRLGVPEFACAGGFGAVARDSGRGDCDFYLDGYVALYCPDKPNASEAARCVGYGFRAENSKSRALSRHVSAPPFRCQICASDRLQTLPGFSALPRATSNSKPWPSGGSLAVCGACGAIQKLPDPEVDGRGEENLCRLRDLPSVGGLGAAHLR